jgi:ABC-type Fe3+ transport system substrate-binding protein
MKNLWFIGLIVAVVAVPLLLRPDSETGPKPDDVLVIVSPHNEAVRYEFTRAFVEHYRAKTGRQVLLDWRTPGGTSEISRYLASEYLASFQNYWTRDLGKAWNGAVEAAFDNQRIALDDTPGDDSPEEEARRAFLQSDVGCGIDLFFGGGAYDFEVQASAGRLVDSGVLQRHPEWFGEDGGIPRDLGGEELWDPEGRWVGACLSAFGICYNVDVLAMLGVRAMPSRWDDLADPRFIGQVGLADPMQSGSAAKAFEMLIQQQMQERLATAPTEAVAVEEGWIDGLRIIQRAAGNARYFSDSASKIPWDVELGDAAIGMCIDFYGRFQSEAVRKPDGSSRMIYVTPTGGSSVGADPIGLLRGAPHPEVAKQFLDFVLSVDGQKLWNFEVGTPGGPRRFALRRLPIRPELYAEEWVSLRSDPEVDPYREAGAFVYHGEWTGALFGAIRFIVRTMCIDAHDELRNAWRALVAADFPPEATAVFGDLSHVRYAVASDEIRKTLRSSDKIEQVRLAKELSDGFRAQYLEAERLAASQK